MSAQDFVQTQDGCIYWDDNANNQETTKEGETYLGKVLTFTFNSYIDDATWDGPSLFFGLDPTGDKLTSTITLTASENKAGKLIGISAKKNIVLGPTPIGKARGFYPELGDNQNKFEAGTPIFSNGVLTNFSLSFEQHASVSPFEEVGLHVMGYDIVNVAQSLNLSYTNNRLSVTAATDLFPSATLTLNGALLFNYTQPSFQATHGRESSFSDNGMGGAMTNDISRRAPASFYPRFNK